MVRFFLSSILILLFTIENYAQTKVIKGKVSDIHNNPIPYTTISVKGTYNGVAADVDGNFTLEVEREMVTLVFSAVGYDKLEKEYVDVSQISETLKIVLSEDITQLQTVEIIGRRETGYKNKISFSGTKSATPLKEVPQSIGYVTKELALDQAAFTVNEIVKNVSGVNQYSFYNDITIRGNRVRGQQNSGNLVNGMRAFTSFWKQQLIPNIERVEVIKGPASALFGNASAGGTINRVTKKPLKEFRQSISSTVGSFNTFRTLGDFTGPMGKDKSLLYRLNIGYENSGSFRDLQFSKNLVVAPSFSFLPNDRTKLNFDIVYQGSEGRLDRGQAVFGNGDLYSVPTSRSLSAANDYLNETSVNATISFQHKLTDFATFNSVYMRSGYAEDLLEHRTSNQFALKGDGSIDEAKVAMRVFIRKRNWNNNSYNNYFNFKFNSKNIESKLLVGYDYFTQELEPGGSQLEASSYLLKDGSATNKFSVAKKEKYILDEEGNPVTNVAHFNLSSPTGNALRDMSKYVYNNVRNYSQYLQKSHGIYVQEQLSYKNLKLLLGIRKEYFIDVLNYKSPDETEVKQNALLPRIGAVYTVTPNVNLYGTWVKGYQPQLAATINNPEAGGPFDPLTSELFEFGAKTDWFNKRLTASFAIYRLSEQGQLYNANDKDRPDRLEQIGEEVSKGVEVDVTGRIARNWSIVANYSYMNAEITKSDDPSEVGRQKPNAPEHSGNIWTKYTIGKGALKGIGFGVGANFVSERFGSIIRSDEPPVFPAYELVDVALYYKFNKFQIQMNVKNLFDKTHWVGGYDYLRAFPGNPRQVMTTISYIF